MSQEAADAAALITRGGLKLEAAFEHFGLRSSVRGKQALDIGCSHGGFTAAMLRAGAAHVTGVDVGHDQMREPLRSDPRVTLLEGAHFKFLSLQQAAGPFDFFTIDVSFAAARTMLHPLAMRLVPGAEGVVLVKPQFELPKEIVPSGGVVESRNLRKLAFNRFKRKALKEGFDIIDRIPCPVTGGDGNREYLAWLRFSGRPAARDNAVTSEHTAEAVVRPSSRPPDTRPIQHPRSSNHAQAPAAPPASRPPAPRPAGPGGLQQRQRQGRPRR